MSDVLVTGGYGFIGHNVVRKLKDLKHRVAVLDSETNYGIIPDDELEYTLFERKKKIGYVDNFKFDISESFHVNHTVRKFMPDIIIHLASYPRQKVVNKDPATASKVMTEGLLNLLEASVKYNVKKFVYISSSMVYGDFGDNCAETRWCNPKGQYGIMKLAGEWLVRDYSLRTNLEHTIIRPSAVYGPYDVEDRVVSKLLLSAIRDQTLNVNGMDERLDFTYVDDVAEGIVQVAFNDNANNRTYNLTYGRSQTIYNAAQIAVDLTGKGRIQINDKDDNFPSRGSLNIDRAKYDFNYEPKIDLQTGLKLYYEWLKDSPFWSSKTV